MIRANHPRGTVIDTKIAHPFRESAPCDEFVKLQKLTTAGVLSCIVYGDRFAKTDAPQHRPAPVREHAQSIHKTAKKAKLHVV